MCSEDGQLLRVAHLGTGRRILYKYRRQNKLAEILYDSTRVSFTYDETAGVLKTVNLQSEGFICSIRYRQIGPLVDRQIFRFSEDGMVNARFDYTYDNRCLPRSLSTNRMCLKCLSRALIRKLFVCLV